MNILDKIEIMVGKISDNIEDDKEIEWNNVNSACTENFFNLYPDLCIKLFFYERDIIEYQNKEFEDINIEIRKIAKCQVNEEDYDTYLRNRKNI